MFIKIYKFITNKIDIIILCKSLENKSYSNVHSKI